MLLQFKIQLKGISKPPVWRRVLVPGSFTFDRFHLVIQAAFGWENYHLYQFSPRGYGSNPQIGVPYEDDWDEEEIVDSHKTKLSGIFTAKGEKFTYIYDFGDDWVHTVTLEEILESSVKKATLTGGKGACPPEDCGGPWGYSNVLEVLANPKDEEHESMREWLGLEEGEQWDVKHFDMESAKSEVASL